MESMTERCSGLTYTSCSQPFVAAGTPLVSAMVQTPCGRARPGSAATAGCATTAASAAKSEKDKTVAAAELGRQANRAGAGRWKTPAMRMDHAALQFRGRLEVACNKLFT